MLVMIYKSYTGSFELIRANPLKEKKYFLYSHNNESVI